MSISITINAKRERDKKRQQVYFTITKNGTDYEFSWGSVPISLTTDAQIKMWLIQRKDKIQFLVLGKQYPRANPWDFKDPEKSQLENLQAWITARHKNKIKDGEGWRYEVIEKVPFVSNHPAWIKWETQIDSATTVSQLKMILKKIVRRIS